MNIQGATNVERLSTALSTDCIVAVIGAGAMGRGIAQVAATAGHQVLLYDAFPDVADKAIGIMQAGLNKLVAREKITQKRANGIVARVSAAESLNALKDVSLVIEAVVENINIKTELFSNLENILSEDAILTTNTSSLSVTELGRNLQRAERFAGMHFFNPAPILPLVEIVNGAETHFSVAQCLLDTAFAWGKTPVVCGSTPGFIVNRVARPFYGEAMRLLAENAADVATIDALIRESGGFRMGPFELTDLIGQDVNFSVSESVWRGFFGDPRYQPSTVQQELVLSGNLGRKSGRGFYDYAEGVEKLMPLPSVEGVKPAAIKIYGDLGPAKVLGSLAEQAGIEVAVFEGSGFIQIGALKLCLTDGALATEKTLIDGPIAFFDLALDYEKAERIGLAFADTLSQDMQLAAIGFFQALGKQVSVIDDVAGMVVMRTVAMLINEAVDAENLHVATAEDIEVAMTRGVNYPIGLLEWSKRIGQRHVLTVMENLNIASPDGRYRASPLLRRRAAAEVI
jgi:3-hydroxybutyryl-CoA dehydrogenase